MQWIRQNFSGRVAVWLALAVLLSACTHVDTRDGRKTQVTRPQAAQVGCCRQLERYPKWMIRVLEPAAPLIGRTVAQVKWRRGYLAGQPESFARARASLRPLDIIIVGNKGRLSGHLLPGYFTHGAAYLGDEKQLRSLGIWNDPAVRPHQAAIRAGRSVIESDQAGVHLSTLDKVLAADHLAILRPQLSCRDARRQVTRAFFAHLGEKFDFHFDSGEDRHLFCVEMIGHVIPGLNLPQREIYARKSIVPDEVLLQSVRGQLPLDLVLYLRGTRSTWQQRDERALIADIDAYWKK